MTTGVLVNYIDQHREEFGVEPICTVLRQGRMPIAPSSYYAAKARLPSARAVTDQRRLEVIRTVHAGNHAVYGVRKMHAELNRRGHQDRPVHRGPADAGRAPWDQSLEGATNNPPRRR